THDPPRPHRSGHPRCPAARGPHQQYRPRRTRAPVGLGHPATPAAPGTRGRDHRLFGPPGPGGPGPGPDRLRARAAGEARFGLHRRLRGGRARLGRGGGLPCAHGRHGLPAAGRGARPAALLALPTRPPAQRHRRGRREFLLRAAYREGTFGPAAATRSLRGGTFWWTMAGQPSTAKGPGPVVETAPAPTTRAGPPF